jgi:hypothetical protein
MRSHYLHGLLDRVSADEVLQAGQSRQGGSMSEMHDHQWRLRLSVYFGYRVGLLGFLQSTPEK